MKSIRRIAAIGYGVTALIFNDILIRAILYAESTLRSTPDAYIVGSDNGLFFQGSSFICLIVLSNTAFAVMNILAAFKYSLFSKLRWILLIWLAINVVFFLLIPPQSYLVSLYHFFRKLSILNYVNSYIPTGAYLLIIALNTVALLGSKKMEISKK